MLKQREFCWDMEYREQEMLKHLESSVDPITLRVLSSRNCLAEQFKCSPRTVSRILFSLERGNFIRRYGDKRRPNLEIEVLPNPASAALKAANG